MMGWYHGDSRAAVSPCPPTPPPCVQTQAMPTLQTPSSLLPDPETDLEREVCQREGQGLLPSTSSPSSSWTPKFKEFPSPGPGEGRVGTFNSCVFYHHLKKKIVFIKKK